MMQRQISKLHKKFAEMEVIKIIIKKNYQIFQSTYFSFYQALFIF